MRVTIRTGGPQRRSRPAVTAVEFAMVLPVLLLMVLGGVDFGRFAYTYIAVTNAARAGSFYGATNPYTAGTYATWQSKVKQAAADEMGSISGFTMSDVTATGVASGETGSNWRARCTVPCTFTTLVSWPALPQTMTIQQTVEIRAVR
jgi:Flp pilus assembly protein TadG